MQHANSQICILKSGSKNTLPVKPLNSSALCVLDNNCNEQNDVFYSIYVQYMEHRNICVVPSHIYDGDDDDDVIFKVKSFCNR
jgi:hypothetical protein